MSSLTTNLTTLMTAIENLGYSWTDEAFSFDQVPSSTMEKQYRVVMGTGSINEESGSRVMKNKVIDIWTARKFIAAGDKKTAFITIAGEQDTIEDAVFKAITNLPIGINSTESSSLYNDNYIITHYSGYLQYERDI